ncbi:ion transporter [Janthinobacterium agaricidamnosum]|uniref:Ion transport family protein n=1 Tax=Janthinobacterium agaricidamnosum NBRC 102515 = DSM 9628 TaxID=1349767 RepID=W0V0Y6_9BURK|nr:ion transporter [Janthinobacterium agaricidamnosum]CDG81531.1 ion transport family protein [Janthinobacterium agaricidamnosum NBRC 102515 = DSM 9628]
MQADHLHTSTAARQRAAEEAFRLYGKPERGVRERIYTIIFEAETRAGRWFDLCLIAAILLSVTVVVLSSVAAIDRRYGPWLTALEWFFTGLFTVEYVARLSCLKRPLRYGKSFFGIIDLLAIVPTYAALLMPGAHVLLDVRILRLLRMFRILKLTSYVHEYSVLGRALMASRRKILIFLSFVMLVVFLLGTVMYVVEGPQSGFTSIPTSVYWAISTVTTVGFGDIAPKTDLGRTISSLMMLLGWGILAVPTGIISAEMTAQRHAGKPTTRTCTECLTEGHEADAKFCKDCGAGLPPFIHAHG